VFCPPRSLAVVLAVVDVADFDGSLPRAALKALLPRDTETGGLKTPRDVDLVIAVNKVSSQHGLPLRTQPVHHHSSASPLDYGRTLTASQTNVNAQIPHISEHFFYLGGYLNECIFSHSSLFWGRCNFLLHLEDLSAIPQCTFLLCRNSITR
jgi:hypothetical protein